MAVRNSDEVSLFFFVAHVLPVITQGLRNLTDNDLGLRRLLRRCFTRLLLRCSGRGFFVHDSMIKPFCAGDKLLFPSPLHCGYTSSINRTTISESALLAVSTSIRWPELSALRCGAGGSE